MLLYLGLFAASATLFLLMLIIGEATTLGHERTRSEVFVNGVDELSK